MTIVKLMPKRPPDSGLRLLDFDVIEALARNADGQDDLRDRWQLIMERLISIDHALRREDPVRIARLARNLAGLAGSSGLPAIQAQARALADCADLHDHAAAAATGLRLLATGEATLLRLHGQDAR